MHPLIPSLGRRIVPRHKRKRGGYESGSVSCCKFSWRNWNCMTQRRLTDRKLLKVYCFARWRHRHLSSSVTLHGGAYAT